jgi:hypothetical protein
MLAVVAGLCGVAVVVECLAEDGEGFGFRRAVAVVAAELGGAGGKSDGFLGPGEVQAGQGELGERAAFLASVTGFLDDVHRLSGTGHSVLEPAQAPAGRADEVQASSLFWFLAHVAEDGQCFLQAGHGLGSWPVSE